MNAQHIWVIPDQGTMRGGELYDRWGNLTYFADTAGLDDKTTAGVDKQVNVKAHSASRFMRDPAPYQVSATAYTRSYGNGQSKGAFPGYTVTFVSDAGLPGEEKRDFTITCTMSALVAWLKTTAKMQVEIYGPTGSMAARVPAATP